MRRLRRLAGALGRRRPDASRRERPADGAPESTDYKSLWNDAARADAREAILTGATEETFERTGQEDALRIRGLLADPASARVLNIGCGIGRVERHLAPLVGELFAVDVSGEMIRRARERLASFGNVVLREVASDEYLAFFPDGFFDLVFSLLVLQHVEKEDAFRYLEDARRVLRPGGILFVQFPNLLSPEYSHAFRSAIASRPRNPARVRPYVEAEVRHLVALAGFDPRELTVSGGSRGDAEIYVVAVRRE